MRVDRITLVRGAQLLLILPSSAFAGMALMAGTAGVLGGLAAAAGLFGSGIELDPQQEILMPRVYLAYILACIELMLLPALGYGLLILLIIKGAVWMAARRAGWLF